MRSELASAVAAVPGRRAADPAEVWVIVPAFNEAPRLGRVLRDLCRRHANVVVVDDGSGDDTGAVALTHGAWLVRHPVNSGQGAALQTGIDFALARGAEVLVTFDADGQHSVADVEALVRPILRGDADVALGSRFLGATVGIPWSRWALLKLAVAFTRLTTGLRVTDTHNGLRALARSAARRIQLTQNRMAHASEILSQVRAHGLRYVEVPVTIRYTGVTLAKGQTSWNAVRIALQLLLAGVLR